ncbi:hypothetical protein [Amycolatopsis sp. NPDC058986]|uniref:hypothetical protein n=1 Tax=unclassified Amycolatopsis TaxID=2618356 RepID=UPI00366F1C44
MPSKHPEAHRPQPSRARHRDRATVAEPVGSVSVMNAAESAFRLLCTGPEPLAVDCTRIGRGLPRRCVPLVELRDVVLDRATTAAARAAVWRELVLAAQTCGPAWVIGAVGVALPGLRKAAGELATGYTGDVEDIDAEMLAGFTTRLKEIDPDAGSLGPRLVWAAQRAGAKLRTAEWDYAAHTVPRWESFEPRQPDHGHPELVLAEAVREGVLTATEASLIADTRLDDMHLYEAAEKLGDSYFRVRRAREKAESALISWLGAQRPAKKSKSVCKKPA